MFLDLQIGAAKTVALIKALQLTGFRFPAGEYLQVLGNVAHALGQGLPGFHADVADLRQVDGAGAGNRSIVFKAETVEHLPQCLDALRVCLADFLRHLRRLHQGARSPGPPAVHERRRQAGHGSRRLRRDCRAAL